MGNLFYSHRVTKQYTAAVSLILKADCLKRHCITLASPKAELKNLNRVQNQLRAGHPYRDMGCFINEY